MHQIPNVIIEEICSLYPKESAAKKAEENKFQLIFLSSHTGLMVAKLSYEASHEAIQNPLNRSNLSNEKKQVKQIQLL